jgi:phosphoserine aminotransferase
MAGMSLPYGRTYNFSAGPGAIPVPVLEEARDHMLNWKGSGVGVMEMSHRGKHYGQIAADAENYCRQLMGVPENYKILFLQGGASLQFTMLAMNFLNGGSADYLRTGSWSEKAVSSAKLHGDPRMVLDTKSTNYDRASYDNAYNEGSKFVHYTMNETIQGVDFLADPAADGRDWICDMSSCIASRPFDVSRYAMIYAGAQKNLGPSGVTLVLIRDDMVARIPEGLPPMLDYRVQVENEWMYNTPATWGVYICSLTFKHWIDFGGLEAVGQYNEEKAGMIYAAIDGSDGFFKVHAVPENRSRMNISFTLATEELTQKFLDESKAGGFHELKGHRSVGGCRASIYNAFPKEGCADLAQFMSDFARANR